jgi:hypothetical protein
MPKEDIFSQLEETGPWQGETVADTEGRVLRRLVTELLPAILPWASNKDSLTQMALRDTLKDKENFERADQQSWKNILEEYLQKELEVIILRSGLEMDGLLRPSTNKGSLKKNLLVSRFLELAENDAHEDTLIVAWHKSHGALGASLNYDSEFDSPTGSRFPELRRWLHWKLDREINPENQKAKGLTLTIWSWDRKNFIFDQE